MSDTLSAKQIDVIVLKTICDRGSLSRGEIEDLVVTRIYPNSPVRRETAIERSVARLRKHGRITCVHGKWHAL